MFDRPKSRTNNIKLWAKIASVSLNWKRKKDILNDVFKTNEYDGRNKRGHYSTYFLRMKDNDLLLFKKEGRYTYYKLNPNHKSYLPIFNNSQLGKIKEILS